MKTALIAALWLVALLHVGAQEDPFADSPSDPPRPEREIVTIPKAISYESVDGSHVYTIKGIYVTSPKHNIDDPGSLVEAFIPDCENCTFDFAKRICTIRTKRKLTNSELAYAIDDIARMGGDMPYWAELDARDMPDADVADLDFVIEEFKGEFPKKVAWFWLSGDQPFETPFGITSLYHYKVRIVPMTAYCMCHSRYCIRVLDTEGKVIWIDSKTAYAAVSVALSEADDGLGHELLIRRNDHGGDACFTLKINREKVGAEQSATAPESKPEGKQKPKPESEGHSQ